MSERYIQLKFNNQTQPLERVKIGIPQGSPISPIVRFSHCEPEYGLDEIVGGFGSARRAFGTLRQSTFRNRCNSQ